MKNVLVIGATGQIGSELTMLLRRTFPNGKVVAGYIKGCEPKGKLLSSGPSEEVDVCNAKQIADAQMLNHAAICGTYAAQLYGLEVLAEDIQTNKRTFTRFLIIANPSQADALKVGRNINKASLAFTLPHEHGSLSKVLTIFSFYDLNLTKIQSLPIIGHEWEYRFYINLTFENYTRYLQSIDAVRPLINDFKILGEYEEFND